MPMAAEAAPPAGGVIIVADASMERTGRLCQALTHGGVDTIVLGDVYNALGQMAGAPTPPGALVVDPSCLDVSEVEFFGLAGRLLAGGSMYVIMNGQEPPAVVGAATAVGAVLVAPDELDSIAAGLIRDLVGTAQQRESSADRPEPGPTEPKPCAEDAESPAAAAEEPPEPVALEAASSSALPPEVGQPLSDGAGQVQYEAAAEQPEPTLSQGTGQDESAETSWQAGSPSSAEEISEASVEPAMAEESAPAGEPDADASAEPLDSGSPSDEGPPYDDVPEPQAAPQPPRQPPVARPLRIPGWPEFRPPAGPTSQEPDEESPRAAVPWNPPPGRPTRTPPGGAQGAPPRPSNPEVELTQDELDALLGPESQSPDGRRSKP